MEKEVRRAFACCRYAKANELAEIQDFPDEKEFRGRGWKDIGRMKS
jgi:hypothetical protein